MAIRPESHKQKVGIGTTMNQYIKHTTNPTTFEHKDTTFELLVSSAGILDIPFSVSTSP